MKDFEFKEKYSIDECFLDYTASVNLLGDPIKTAYKIKDDIYKKFGFREVALRKFYYGDEDGILMEKQVM